MFLPTSVDPAALRRDSAVCAFVRASLLLGSTAVACLDSEIRVDVVGEIFELRVWVGQSSQGI